MTVTALKIVAISPGPEGSVFALKEDGSLWRYYRRVDAEWHKTRSVYEDTKWEWVWEECER